MITNYTMGAMHGSALSRKHRSASRRRERDARAVQIAGVASVDGVSAQTDHTPTMRLLRPSMLAMSMLRPAVRITGPAAVRMMATADTPAMQFSALPISDTLKTAIDSMGLTTATPVQAATLPPLYDLRVEHMKTPVVGVTEPLPRFSWRLPVAGRGVSQQAYRVQVRNHAVAHGGGGGVSMCDGVGMCDGVSMCDGDGDGVGMCDGDGDSDGVGMCGGGGDGVVWCGVV